jgi:hypothetical protein
MTDSEKIAALEEAVTRLEAIVGVKYASVAPSPSDIGPHNELPSGRYPLMLSDYQLRLQGVGPMVEDITMLKEDMLAVNDLLVVHDDRLDAVEAKPAASVDVLAVLRDAPVVRMDGKVCLGMDPVDAHARLQIEGAEILGKSNINATDPQNPNEPHTNVFSLAGNDGGMRWIQYGYWGPNGKKRNTTNRPLSILALDSMGDLCKSTQPVGSDYDGGQSWYIRTSGQFVDFCVYKVGHAIRILKSAAGYGSTDVQQL